MVRRNTPRVENIIAEIRIIEDMFDSHIRNEDMLWIYRRCREDIIERYHIRNKEFNTLYKMARGRL